MGPFTAADIPDQHGRVVVVTGASSGIGLETARALADHGAHVVLACRDLGRGEQAREHVGGSSEVRELDLADLSSVRSFAAPLQDWSIGVLVNNAGVMAVPRGRTRDGFETQLGTNFLGHFALTGLLLPRVTDRVVTVSSLAHHAGRISLDDPNFERRAYRAWAAYGQSKLADLMFAYELQRRLLVAGSVVRSVAAHPGYTATNLQGRSGRPLLDAVLRCANRLPLLAQSAGNGALPTLYAATAPDVPGGSLVGPSGPLEMQGAPRVVGSSAASHDRDTAAGLWDLAERLTGVRFDLPVVSAPDA